MVAVGVETRSVAVDPATQPYMDFPARTYQVVASEFVVVRMVKEMKRIVVAVAADS